jgi:hypothetical protein
MHPDFPLDRPKTHIEVLALLDKYFPNITDNIQLNKLDMFCERRCVLGQTIKFSNLDKMFKPEGTYQNLDWNFANDANAWKQAVLDYRKQKVSHTDTALYDRTVAELEDKIKQLKGKRQDFICRSTKVMLELTKDEIENLLNRRFLPNVKSKLKAALTTKS